MNFGARLAFRAYQSATKPGTCATNAKTTFPNPRSSCARAVATNFARALPLERDPSSTSPFSVSVPRKETPSSPVSFLQESAAIPFTTVSRIAFAATNKAPTSRKRKSEACAAPSARHPVFWDDGMTVNVQG